MLRVWARVSVEPHSRKMLLGGRAIKGGRVRAQVGLPNKYPGTRHRKNRGNKRGNPCAEARAPVFPFVCVSRSPPPALEVTWDLDKEDRRVGRRGNDLGAWFTGYGGGIDEQPREEAFLPAYLRLDRSHARARLG
jgi:hypothetical protein